MLIHSRKNQAEGRKKSRVEGAAITSQSNYRSEKVNKQGRHERRIDLNVCLFNVQGLIGNTYSKLDDPFLKNLFDKYDILCFTDTG